MEKPSKTFCILPWASLNTWPDGRVTPCCVATYARPVGSLLDSSIEEIWNGERMRALRKRMLNGEQSLECLYCHELEAAGLPSTRTSSNERFSQHLPRVRETAEDGSVARVNLPYLEIRFSNVCNFRCRICSPALSSGWYGDIEAIEGKTPYRGKPLRPFGDPERFLEQLEPYLPDLEEIYFAGGEPLLMDEHYRVLEFLRKKKLFDVKLYYSTNFSKLRYRSYDLLKLWRPFKDVTVSASLDGTEARGEYLRKGQVWSEVEDNRRKLMRERPDLKFRVAFTLNLMNALHLPDFHREWVEKGLVGADDFRVTLLQWPFHYRLQVLPKPLKKAVRQKYERHIAEFAKTGKIRDSLEDALRFMEHDDMSGLLPEFRSNTQKLDELRSESFERVFPELAFLMSS